jgi:hypothetical protein
MKLRETAREGALQYDADLVTNKYWAPTLKVIEDKLEVLKKEQNRNTTPISKGVTSNRAQRRRQERQSKKNG